MTTTLYGLRSTAQCDPVGKSPCIRSTRGKCKVGTIIDSSLWQSRNINTIYKFATEYNNKKCGCRAEVVEIGK